MPNGGSVTVVVHPTDSTAANSWQCRYVIESEANPNSAEVPIYCWSMKHRCIDSALTCRQEHHVARPRKWLGR
jgi:hypothetical protein